LDELLWGGRAPTTPQFNVRPSALLAQNQERNVLLINQIVSDAILMVLESDHDVWCKIRSYKHGSSVYRAGRRLFYPAAGSDWNEILLRFADYIDEFHFCDNGRLYWDLEALQSEWPFENPSLYRRSDPPEIDGPSQTKLDPAIGYPNLERGYLREIYQRLGDGRQLKVVRRRGFGQCALAEFPARSIGVFVHRGDSPTRGEGGSNLYFLANKKRDYEPSSNLFDKLALRLSDGALIFQTHRMLALVF
jgi:hypothetical protein